jgi:LysM repeat protein
MTLRVRMLRGGLMFLLMAGLSGCLPSGQGSTEEEKEPHFLAGRNCISSMDYKGAIEEFEKALEANPHSAAAHRQLGILYEEREPDPAAAIYHYEQFLELRPNAENADVIRQHINNCKQDLAKTVLPLTVSPAAQHEFEQLAEENKQLREELDKWRAYAARLQAATNVISQAAPGIVVAERPVPASPATFSPAGGQLASVQPAHPEASVPGSTGMRTYVVKSGDSLYGIARRTGVKLDALKAANPGLEPLRMRVGQTINIPAP